MVSGVSDESATIKKRRAPRRGSTQLDAQAWMDAALAELGAQGIDGVRVEVLAKRLNVTKGSFYWHFKDRDALLERMLERWRRRATISLIERLDSDVASPLERLRQLLRLPLKGQASVLAADVELAIRLWGRSDERARRALEEVDELRLQYITGLMAKIGVPEGEVRARAVLAYSYQRVARTLISADAIELARACENVLMNR